MTDAPTDRQPSVGRPRAVPVTAVVVTRGLTEYVTETLDALAAQARRPQHVLVVDAEPTGPAGPGGAAGPDPEVLRAARRLSERADLPVTVLTAPGTTTFGAAVRAALAQDPEPQTGDGAWLWLLHDDSAPAPDALAELLRAVEVAPSVAVAGAKQHTWSGPVRVLEVGMTTSRFGRRMTGIDEPEVDQGQHDGREDVLGVGIAGALVRRDVWDELGGPDPALGPYGDGLDLSRRARLAGHRVVVVPRAVVRHAQASMARPVAGAVLNRPGWDARRSTQARREAYLHAQLTGAPLPLVPVVVVLAVVSGVVRALARLVTNEPHLVGRELVAPWVVLARPDRIVRARRRATRTRRLPRRSLRGLQVTWRDVLQQARDRRLAAAELRRTRQAPSELELAELATLRSRRRSTLAVVAVLGVAVTAAALGPLITRVLAGARLTGGSLPAGDAGLAETWAAAISGWVPTALGSPGPADPLLAVLVPLTALTGSVGGAASLVLLGSLLLCALGAWFAAGAATRSAALRAWAALVWTAAPALLVALGDGRLGAVLAHAALPWVALAVARAVGAARVDVIASGLVGATGEAVVPRSALGEPVTVSRTNEPSLAAAAGAGLALAVVTAAAPVLLPAALVVLVGVAVAVPRRGRLVWVAVPSLALHGPLVAEAVRTWDTGGWRLLLADPGLPVPGGAAPAWQQLLGWPVEPPAWVDLAELTTVVALVATGVVVLVALLALVRAAPVARAVRVGWFTAALGLAAALVASRVHTGITEGADIARLLTTGWQGTGLSLALLGLLAAALVGADGVRTAVARHTFGWRQVTAGALTVLAVLGPAAVLGAWTWHVRTSGTDGAPAVALTTTEAPVVPAVGRQMQASPDDVRVLALEVGAAGDVAATLLRQDGRQLTEVSRSVTARQVNGGWGHAVPAGPDEARAELADAVARLAAGSSDEVAGDLARLGVGAVLVPPVTDQEAAGPVTQRSAVVGRLDSTLGLERMTQTESGVIWRVAVGELDTTAAWARLVASSGGADGELLGAVPAADGTIDTELAPGDQDRLLVLAERADDGWHAELDGQALRAVPSQWRQAFEVGPQGGRLTVEHAAAGRTPWLVLQGTVLLVTVLLAVPARRRRGGLR